MTHADNTPDIPTDVPREPHATHALDGFMQLLRSTLDDPKNVQKGGWLDKHPSWLLDRLFGEARELRRAVEDGRDAEHIARECADVAIFAMMLADVVGGLPVQEAPPAPIDPYKAPEIALAEGDLATFAVHAKGRIAELEAKLADRTSDCTRWMERVKLLEERIEIATRVLGGRVERGSLLEARKSGG